MASFEQELVATLLKVEEVWLKNIRLTMSILEVARGGEWSVGLTKSSLNFKGLAVSFFSSYVHLTVSIFIKLSWSLVFFQRQEILEVLIFWFGFI